MHLLEPREHPSQIMKWLSPIIALLAMLIVGSLLFLALGVDPLNALYIFFIEPLTSIYSLSELAIKASPLILIALEQYLAVVLPFYFMNKLGGGFYL